MSKDIAPVLEEIAAVLQKHDMAGLVMVANISHTDWRLEISPSWSCAQVKESDDDGHMLRIRSKKADYVNEEDRIRSLEATISTFNTFIDTMRAVSGQLTQVLTMIGRHIDFTSISVREDGPP